MPEDASDRLTQSTLAEAVNDYLQGLKASEQIAREQYLRRFIEHMGSDLPCASLTRGRVESYNDTQIRPTDPNAQQRVNALKAWFQFLRKKGYTAENYGPSIRAPRGNQRPHLVPQVSRVEDTPVEMTAAGLDERRRELDELRAQRPSIVQAIAAAREDKDFRENAPLHAAREQLGMTDGRIKQLEDDIKRAVVIDRSGADVATIGSVVTVTRLDNSVRSDFTLVGAREANARLSRISIESPVGQKLLNRHVGDEVTIVAPSGEVHYRIDNIARS